MLQGSFLLDVTGNLVAEYAHIRDSTLRDRDRLLYIYPQVLLRPLYIDFYMLIGPFIPICFHAFLL